MSVIFEETFFSNPDQSGGAQNIFTNRFNILSQNCNSLNMADLSLNKNRNKFNQKIAAIFKENADIVLLQDTRLGNKLATLKNEVDLANFGSFDIYANSESSTDRGVIVFIKKKLPYKMHRSFSSNCNNALLLDMSIFDTRILLCNLYAPTQSQNRNFFKDIKSKIENIAIDNFFILGDLNSITNINNEKIDGFLTNPEVLFMKSIPNPAHSKFLVEWLQTGELIDSYRILYPFEKTFSHTPFNKQANDKSRIDLFLCSNNFHENVHDIQYLCPTSKAFDHCPLKVSIGKKRKIISKRIDSSLLDLDFLYETVKFGVYELITNHFNLPNLPTLKENLKSINSLSLQLQSVYVHHIDYPNDIFIKQIISNLENEINILCNQFPEYSDIFEFECNIDEVAFFNLLTNNIFNATISFQSSYTKNLMQNKRTISKKLDLLRKQGHFCSPEAKDLETQLLVINEEENKKVLSNNVYFELINHEKPSRAFSSLIKNGKKIASLDNIHDYDGNPFASPKQRNYFLMNHYKSILGDSYTSNFSLENFLGRDINDPLFNCYKIFDHEKNDFNQPFSLLELDKSLESSNINSAPGIDGFPCKAIKKFWPLLRIPTCKAFNKMILDGKLPPTLRISMIKLIEKANKPDYKNIKSWRPISLLSSFYKLFSGIVDLRLQKVLDRIIHRAQKAYSKERVIQENLLNLIETMSKGINSNNPLALILIDFQGAFDNISHSYIYEALKFHNFGEGFINIVKTCFNDREACIQLEDGFTNNFSVKRSVLQGDRPSPSFFKLAVNPLIIKLCTLVGNLLPASLPLSLPLESPDNLNSLDCCGAFADDMEAIIEPKTENLEMCHKIFEDFGNLSNLRINASKTKVILIGETSPDFINCISKLGYETDNEFCMLGLNIDAKLEKLNKNWDNVFKKVQKIKNFWALFHLSLPGRINIIKTYFFSQLSYVGTLLDPPPLFLEHFDNCVINFLNAGLKISKNRIFEEIEKGGLGLFRAEDFIKSLKINLFKRGTKSSDTWGIELRSFLAHKNEVHSSDVSKINKKHNPIILNLCENFNSFCENFWRFEGNLLKSNILYNRNFVDHNDKPLDCNFFNQQTWTSNCDTLLKLTLSEIIDARNKPFPYQYTCNILNISWSFFEYMRVRTVIEKTLKKHGKNLGKKSQSLNEFLKKPKLKAKNFRKFIQVSELTFNKCRPTKTRYSWANIEVDIFREKRFYKTWSIYFLPINIKDFATKLLNNKISFNANLAHFHNVSPNCYFCSKNNPQQLIPKETAKHFFTECQTTTTIFQEYFLSFLSHKNIIWENKFCIVGCPSEIKNDWATVLNIEILLVNQYVLSIKNKKKPLLLKNLSDYTYWLRSILCRNHSYKALWSTWCKNPR